MNAEMAIQTELEDAPAEPRQATAPNTHPLELRRLAAQEQTDPACRTLNVQVYIWILRAYGALSGQLAAELREHDLSPSSWNVLMALRNTPDQTLEPHELASRLLVTRPSVTGLVDTLARRGLVERRPHETDGRRVRVWLTDQARTLMDAHFPTHYANLNDQMGALSEEEKATLVTLLRKVEGAVPEHLQGPATGAETDPVR